VVLYNHLEKYDFVKGKDDNPYIMENKKCLVNMPEKIKTNFGKSTCLMGKSTNHG